MKNQISLSFRLLAMFIILTLSFIATSAHAQEQEYERVYFEDFNDDQAQDWDLSYPGWSVGDGRLNGFYYPATALYKPGFWGDSEVRFRFAPGDINGTLYFNVRVSDAGYYRLDLTPMEDSELRIHFSRYLSNNKLAGSPLETSIVYQPTEYIVSIIMDGGTFWIYVYETKLAGFNLLPLITYDDPDPLPPGTISFSYEYSSSVWVDDIEVFLPYRYITGGIYEGFSPDRSQPLAGIVVYGIGADAPYPSKGSEIARTTTDPKGQYNLRMSPGYSYYAITYETPAGYTLQDAISRSGKVMESNWIQFNGPLPGTGLGGNDFWVRPFDTPTPTNTPSRTPTHTPSKTPTRTPSRTPTRTPIPPTRTSTPTLVITPTFPPPPPVTPTPICPEGWPCDVLIPGVLIGGGLLIIGGGLALVRLLRKPPQPPPQEPEKPPEKPDRPPLIPILPPVRLVKVWLSEGAEKGGRPLSDHSPLQPGAPYSLHVQMPALKQPEASARPASATPESITPLKLVFFSPEQDFNLDRSPATLHVPEQSASNEIRRVITPQAAGTQRVRACLYYGNVLVQSALVEAEVGSQPSGGIQRTIDYVANASLTDLEKLPQPSVNIFTNQVSDGTHWIGVYSAGGASGPALRSGSLQTFSESELKERSKELRQVLSTLQGGSTYRYASPLPLDAAKLARYEQDMLNLALAGWKAFHSLLLAREYQITYDQLPSAQSPGLISIARCRGNSPTVPWAALYDLRLETGHPEALHMCAEFKAQLTANVWSADQRELVQKRDLLDNLRACRNLPGCPLKGTDRKLTVCPFGFWGYIHQVEQPLQNVTPTQMGRVPPELDTEKEAAHYAQTDCLVRPSTEKVHMAIGIYPGIPDVAAHLSELQTLGAAGTLDITSTDDRDQVLALLERGDRHLYYLYCHGVIREQEFRLLLGPAGRQAYLSAADLDPRETHWEGDLHPLVILNGCETMRLSPELIHGFLGVLRQIGASGVVGSEIPVNVLLARPFGVLLIKRLLSGLSIGEAFLDIRRFLQRQGNPLGLAYTYYSPASLHLHDPQSCAWCQTRRPGTIHG